MYYCFVFVLCFAYVAAVDISYDVLKELKSLRQDVTDLKSHVQKLETFTGVLTKGHTRRQSLSHSNIAFDALLSHDYIHGEQQYTLKFDEVLTNNGNAYDKNTGTFTAPIPGTYLFNWSIRSGYAASLITKLMLNGREIEAAHTDSSMDTTNGFEAHSSKTAILNLKNGDKVYIENFPQRGQIHSSSNGHSGFVGTLLFANDNE